MIKYLPALLCSILLSAMLIMAIGSSRQHTKLAEDAFFSECVKNNSDLEFRRNCGKAAYAYANGKIDYQAYGKTITWDKEARMYVIKGDK